MTCEQRWHACAREGRGGHLLGVDDDDGLPLTACDASCSRRLGEERGGEAEGRGGEEFRRSEGHEANSAREGRGAHLLGVDHDDGLPLTAYDAS